MQNNLEIIRAACVKANPDILKLEFGCRVQMPISNIIRKHQNMEEDDDRDAECIVLDYGSGGYNGEDYDGDTLAVFCPDWMTSKIFGEGSHDDLEMPDYEVLGRPILPQDIQKILPNYWMMKWVEGAKRFNFVNMRGYGTRSFKNEYITWRDAPLTEQTEEQVALLAAILK